MKRMILTLDTLAVGGKEEVDRDLVEELLDDAGFAHTVETEEGAITVLPSNAFYGEFDDEVTTESLADALETSFGENGLEIGSLLITEMGQDQVLIGEELEESDEDEESEEDEEDEEDDEDEDFDEDDEDEDEDEEDK